jgi:predicted acetyltransferase
LNRRKYPLGMTATLHFAVQGNFLAENDGAYELTVSAGQAKCSDADQANRTLTPQGLALLYAGTQSCANLRMAGHLTGGDITEDLDWDALFGGRQRHIRDRF